jgi:DNA repair exonuclease SbcCD ATPase subunit
MATEILNLDVKSNIESVTKETDQYKKSLDQVNKEIKLQNKYLIEQEKELIKLKAQQDAIPKGAWVAGMEKLNDKIKATTAELKLEKNALKGLKNEQKEATEEAKKFAKAQDDQAKATHDSIGNFAIMGVSLNGVKAAFGKVIPAARAMFATIRAGLISTGIGAFVVLIGSLVAYFTQTKRGADKLAKVFAGLGAAVKVIKDRFSGLGETLLSTFSDPKQAIADLWDAIKKNLLNRLTGIIDGFKAVGKVINAVLNRDWDAVTEGAKEYGQALIQATTGLDVEQQKAFADGVKDIVEEIKDEVEIITTLTQRLHDLRDAENEFIVQKAKTKKAIAEAKLDAQDETKTAEERLAALAKALKMEQETTDKEIALAKERRDIKKEEMKTSENLAEDEAELARLKADVWNKETASLLQQKRLKTEMNSLEKEIAQDEEDRWNKKMADNDAWNKQQIKDAKDAENRARSKAAMELAFANQGLQLIGDAAGEGTALAKAAAIAQATMSGIQGVQNAFTAANANIGATAGTFGAYPVTMASIAGAFAAMNIAKIASGSPPTTGDMPDSPSTVAPSPQMMSGAFELTGGQEAEPLQAYVVSDDITNSQNALAIIRRRATI